MVAVPITHRLAERESVSMVELADEPFISYAPSHGSQVREVMVRLADEAGFLPHVVQEAPDPYSLLALVGAQVGVAVVVSSSDHIRIDGVRRVHSRARLASQQSLDCPGTHLGHCPHPPPLPHFYLTAAQQPGAGLLGRRRIVLRARSRCQIRRHADTSRIDSPRYRLRHRQCSRSFAQIRAPDIRHRPTTRSSPCCDRALRLRVVPPAVGDRPVAGIDGRSPASDGFRCHPHGRQCAGLPHRDRTHVSFRCCKRAAGTRRPPRRRNNDPPTRRPCRSRSLCSRHIAETRAPSRRLAPRCIQLRLAVVSQRLHRPRRTAHR